MQRPSSLPLTFWPSSHPTSIYIYVSKIPPPSPLIILPLVCASPCAYACVELTSLAKSTLYYVYILTHLLFLGVNANNDDYYNQTAPPTGFGQDTEVNTTIRRHGRSRNTAKLDPVRPDNMPLYESLILGGSIGEHVEVQQSPAYQAMPMPDYLWNYYHYFCIIWVIIICTYSHK